MEKLTQPSASWLPYLFSLADSYLPSLTDFLCLPPSQGADHQERQRSLMSRLYPSGWQNIGDMTLLEKDDDPVSLTELIPTQSCLSGWEFQFKESGVRNVSKERFCHFHFIGNMTLLEKDDDPVSLTELISALNCRRG
jgi:hypothetical protein